MAAPTDKPLQGLAFLNTRDSRSAPRLTGRLERLGARVVACPTIAFVPPESWAPFDERVARLTAHDCVVFTSANAVGASLERLEALGRPPATLGAGPIAAIGQGTRDALQEAGLPVALVPALAQQEGLLALLCERLRPGDRVWIPRAQEAREELVEGLRQAGFAVEVTTVYRTVPPSEGLGAARAELLAGRIDWLLFTSSSTVLNFCAMLDAEVRAALAARDPHVACIGAITADAARHQGLPVHVVPAQQDLDGLLEALVDYVRDEAAGSRVHS